MTSITVTTESDTLNVPPFVSLRDAVNQALSGPDTEVTINFSPNVLNILLINPIIFTRPTPITININGNGTTGTPGGNPRITTDNAIPISSRPFEIISDNIILNLTNFTMSDTLYGAIRIGDSAISISGIVLRLNSMLMENNICEQGFYNFGGAVANFGNSSVILINSIFNRNGARQPPVGTVMYGGAVAMIGGSLNVDGCTFDSNRANSSILLPGNGGGAIFITTSSSENIIKNSTLSNNNMSNSFGGAMAMTRSSGSIRIINTTVANNTAEAGGGLYFFEVTGLPRRIINTTIYGNTGLQGAGGILKLNFGIDTDPIVLNNTLLAANSQGSGGGPDLTGNFTGSTYNIVSDDVGVIGITNGVDNNRAIPNISNTLSPLGDYGGARQTVALLAGSPAINTGSNALVPVDTLFDCRGTPFDRIVDSIVDIGAYEYNPIICYLGNSITLTKDSTTGKISRLPVKSIISDRHLVFDTMTKKYVPVKFNIVTGPTDSIMLLKKNSLGLGTPSKDFYITSGHKIILGDREIKVRDIPRIQTVKIEPQNVYSICTENKAVILINNVKVLTWPLSEWTEYSKKVGVVWKNNSYLIEK